MAKTIDERILVLLIGATFVVAGTAAAGCSRSSGAITCVNGDLRVIEGLPNRYKNEVKLIVENSSIPVLRTGIFDELGSVRILSLKSCGIAEIAEGALRGLTLTDLNLAWNSIELLPADFFNNLNTLENLDLSHNNIFRLEFRGARLPILNYLDVSDNDLIGLKFVGSFDRLKTVNLANNNLEDFEDDWVLRFPKIETVLFAGNSLDEEYEEFLTTVLTSSNVRVDSDDSFAANDRREIVDGKNEMRMPKNERELSRFGSLRVRRALPDFKQILKCVTGSLSLRGFIDTLADKICNSLPERSILQRFRKKSCRTAYELGRELITGEKRTFD